MKRKNITTIQITGSTLSPQMLAIYLDKLCWLRSARKIGDIENVNNTQLGRLNMQAICITYKKL